VGNSVPSHSPHILQLLSLSSLSITLLLFLFLIPCSCAAIIKPSVSLFNPLLFHYQDLFPPVSFVVVTNLPRKALLQYICSLSHWPYLFSFPSPINNFYSTLFSLSFCCFLMHPLKLTESSTLTSPFHPFLLLNK